MLQGGRPPLPPDHYQRRNAKVAVLEGMRHLDKEFRDHEASVAKAADDAKKLIEQGMGKL